MKKALIAVLLVLLTLGLFVSCNGEVDEKVFTNSYKIQSDGTWKMGGKVYGPSTKPYILVLPKSLNIEKDVQLADLQKGMLSLDEIRTKEGEQQIGNATIELIPADGDNPEYYKYKNSDDKSKAQNIFMKTHDDFSETIELNAPYDEFSHYGSLNIATVEDIASDSYYEYGYLRQIVLKKGHVVVKKQAEVGTIIVEAAEFGDVTIDIETKEVNAVLVPDTTFENVVKSGSVKIGNKNENYYIDEEGTFYKKFSEITVELDNKNLKLLQDDSSAITADYSFSIDLCGNNLSASTLTVNSGKTLTLKDSVGIGKVDATTYAVEGSLVIEGGKYLSDPADYIDSNSFEVSKTASDTYYTVNRKGKGAGYVSEPIYFEAEVDNVEVSLLKQGAPDPIEIEYSEDGSTWKTYEVGTTGITLETAGDKVYFKAKDSNATFSTGETDFYYFTVDKSAAVHGNVMSLLDETCEKDTVPEYAFFGLFSNCSKLTTAPALPATTLADYCYAYMFISCTSLESAPELPATTLANYCYYDMFDGCTALTTAPELPATTLKNSCYYEMFNGCTALVNAPELSATTLAISCCEDMFQGCTSLKTAPKLLATTLASRCYYSMFMNCTKLENAPELPATILADYCYAGMFKDCTSLETAPALPAKTLAESCYSDMFNGCTSLTTAPELPATTLKNGCYYNMFKGCTKLNSVTMLATNVSATDCLKEWLTNTASEGTLYAHSTMVDTFNNNKSTYYIPSGWNVKVRPILCFKAVEAGASVALNKNGNPSSIALVYSTDGDAWKDYTVGTPITTTEVGDEVYFKAKDSNATFSKDSGSYYQFVITDGKMSCAGNIMYLLNSTGTRTDVPANAFRSLFKGCKNLTTAPTLPATTLADSCYYSMFEGCESLETAPELPAETLSGSCYRSMFKGCSSLVKAPELPAETLSNYCYAEMFLGCTSLETAQQTLPATTLANYCYSNMFKGCNSLKTAPELSVTTKAKKCCCEHMFEGCTNLLEAPKLKATSLEEECYYYMFNGCTSLKIASELSATTLGDYCCYGMFNGCTALETAPESLPATTLATGCYYEMFLGCSSLKNAPAELPATTLVSNCYNTMFKGCASLETAPVLKVTTFDEYNTGCSYMFQGCTNLKSVTVEFTEWRGLYLWLENVSETGTFTCPSGLDTSTRDSSHVPSGWNVVSDSYTVSFDMNGKGTAPESQTVLHNGKVVKPTDPTVAGYTLVGWFKEATCENKWDFENDKVTAETTLYAKWDQALCFTAETANASIKLTQNDGTKAISVQISTDGVQWSDYTLGQPIELKSIGDKVYFKGDNTSFSDKTIWHSFVMGDNDKISVGGNVMSLVGFADAIPNDYCFSYLFSSCTGLTTAPELPATTLKDHCYECMFSYCSSLTTAPTLPAEVMKVSCYDFMFHDCTSLITAPALPATQLAEACYSGMFDGCTSLITAPALPATQLVKHCYHLMFFNCPKLNSVNVSFTSWNTNEANGFTYSWIDPTNEGGSVSPTGTFTCPSALCTAGTASGDNFGSGKIPEGWTVVNP